MGTPSLRLVPLHGTAVGSPFIFISHSSGEQTSGTTPAGKPGLPCTGTPNNPTSPPPGEGKLRQAAGPRLSEQQGEDAGADPKPTQTNRWVNARRAASQKGSSSSAAPPCPAPELRPSGKPSHSPGAAPARGLGMPKSPLCQQLVRGRSQVGAPGGLPEPQRSTKRGEAASEGQY